MSYELSELVMTLLDERLATGKYASEDEVLLRALQMLREYDEALADIQDGMDDEVAGRLHPLNEADGEIRRNLGFTI